MTNANELTLVLGATGKTGRRVADRLTHLTLPVGDVREPFVDAEDIAEVAVAALTEDGHARQLYEVTGPRMLTFAQAVAEIAEATGREIAYVEVPADAYAAGAAEQGLPPEV